MKQQSLTELVEAQVADAVPVVHYTRRVIVGFLTEVPATASCVTETVDRMMEMHGLQAHYISKAQTRNGRVFILAHDCTNSNV